MKLFFCNTCHDYYGEITRGDVTSGLVRPGMMPETVTTDLLEMERAPSTATCPYCPTKVRAEIRATGDSFVVSIDHLDFWTNSTGPFLGIYATRAELGDLMAALSAEFAALLAKEEKADA